MSKYIRTYSNESPEFARLQRAADIMTARSPKGYHYYVSDTYFDFGQDWIWTTILCDGGMFGGYQALTPAEQERIITGNIEDAVDAVFAGKYCPDHIDEDRINARNKVNVAGLFAIYGNFGKC